MKRLVIAIILLTAVITFSFNTYFTVNKKIDYVITLMEIDRESTMREGKPDSKRTAEITEVWDKNETYLISMLTHHELETFEIGMMCLPNYQKQALTEEYIKTLNECINCLYHVKETEKVDTKNIF